ncbi:MAG: iron-sulfur cluster assembly accessory protein [Deltaproteobacteria bacterium]|mgnify:CR=1 FL=1|nr:iron-sulfur cluster assembly accessory protein [Deltaproteobacteria bacterium]
MDRDVKVSENDAPITLTEAAVRAARDAIVKDGSAGDFLRVSISGGGCSGYQYNLDFDKAPRADDTVITFEGLSVLIDPISGGYLRGTVIDFLDDENGSGFKFDNPNPRRRTCSCGSSWV